MTHSTVLEHDVTIGHRVTLHGCYVESECLIGIGSIVLDGAASAKTRLSRPEPRDAEHANSARLDGHGNQAKVKRRLTDDEIAGIRRSAERYVELAGIYKDLQV